MRNTFSPLFYMCILQFIFNSFIYAGTVPSPWETDDIGAVAATGDAIFSNDTFTITGSGKDIWSTGDEFRFVYQQVDYDVTIIARISSLTNPNAWAKAGVMVRESLDANAVNALSYLTPENGSNFQYRETTGGLTVNKSAPSATVPYWVRIDKAGNLITGYVSSDGSNWTNTGTLSKTMGLTYYVGLAVTAHNDGSLAIAKIDSVTVQPYIGTYDTTAPSIPDGLSSGYILPTNFKLSWNASTDSVGVTAYTVFRDGDSIGTTSSTSMLIKNLKGKTTYSMKVKAGDAVGNRSDLSDALEVITLDSAGIESWPTTLKTGTSGVLTPYSGDLITSSDGQLIENLNINGGIVVNHKNVTIRNCKFGALDIKTTTPTTGENCVVEDSELGWAGRQNFTLRRCFMTVQSNDLIRIGGGNILIEDCYLLVTGPRIGDAHSDNIQVYPVYDYPNIIVNHNTFYNQCEATSCINGPHMTITNNLLAGGSLAIYTSRSTVTDNHFSTVFFPGVGSNGVFYSSGTENTCSGNVIHETNSPVSCPGEIVTVAVTGVSVSPSSLNLGVTQTTDLTENVSPLNATDKSVTWISSNTSVATVNMNGLVTAVSAGNATITVITDDGSFKDSCVVDVSAAVTVIDVEVSDTLVELFVGETFSLTATISPDDAEDDSIIWSSLDTAVATIDQNGLVTAKAEGTGIIVVTTHDNGFTDTCKINVDEVLGISKTANSTSINIHPNPLKGSVLNIQLNGYNINMIIVSISDLTGRTIYNQSHMGESSLNIPVGNLSKGIYIVSVNGNQQKLVIE